jgi:hypothetical protein
MRATNSLVTGAALSVVFAVGYIACALAVMLFPDGTLAFLNNWAHGIDLTLIKRSSTKPIALAAWLSGFVTVTTFGFVSGVLYEMAHSAFGKLAARAPTHAVPLPVE